MLNALLGVSENQSILHMPPWRNPSLMIATSVSMGLHFVVLHAPLMKSVFRVTPLNVEEWGAVLLFSAPVVLLDELLKYFSRNFVGRLKTE